MRTDIRKLLTVIVTSSGLFATNACSLSSPATGDGSSSRFGFLHARGGHVCVAIAAATESDSRVSIISGSDRGTAGRIVRRAVPCDLLESAGIDGPFYEISILRPLTQELAVVTIGHYRTLSVTECTSQEGVHYNVWSGEPLVSARLWHGYWHAGYDVEETCTDAETKDLAS